MFIWHQWHEKKNNRKLFRSFYFVSRLNWNMTNETTVQGQSKHKTQLEKCWKIRQTDPEMVRLRCGSDRFGEWWTRNYNLFIRNNHFVRHNSFVDRYLCNWITFYSFTIDWCNRISEADNNGVCSIVPIWIDFFLFFAIFVFPLDHNSRLLIRTNP